MRWPPLSLLGLVVALAFPVSLSAQLGLRPTPGEVRAKATNWDRYVPRTLQSILDEHSGLPARQAATGDSVLGLSADAYPTRAELTYTGEERPLSPARRALITGWLHAMGGRDTAIAQRYGAELRFREGERTYWIPVQDAMLPWVHEHLQPGDSATVFVLWMGALTAHGRTEWLFLATGI